jgi:DNA invertase Pin-like site-specific DNA recombinase
MAPRRVAIYCRVSTTGQTVENQLLALRAFADARGWVTTEFIDQGQSGAKEKRPQLDALLAAVRARKVDVVACVKLDRLARSVHHLVAMVRDLEVLGVDLIVLDQAIDTTTPSGRLLFHVLAAISEFERDLIRDRVLAGLKRARAQGTRLGRPRTPVDLGRVAQMRATGASVRAVARALGIAPMSVSRALADLAARRAPVSTKTPSAEATASARPSAGCEGRSS